MIIQDIRDKDGKIIDLINQGELERVSPDFCVIPRTVFSFST